jgi:hypothetical protein
VEDFATVKKQSNRVYYLDLARGLAIFFMIMQHSIIIHGENGGDPNTIIGSIFILLGTAPAAPVFMIIMGAFIMKSNKSMLDGIMRGVRLFLFGYVLNILRFTLPLLISGTSPLFGEESLAAFFEVDIFQLAGLSMIFAAIFKRFASNRFAYPIIIVLVLLLSPYLWGRFSNIPLFIPFWGTQSFVSFPFFPWIIYPLLGMYLSSFLLDKPLMGILKGKFVGIGFVFLIFGALLFDKFPVGDYYRSGFGVHLAIIGFVFIWLIVCYLIIEKSKSVEDNFVLKTLFFWSENITIIYIVQWILFGWSILILDINKQPDYVAAIIGLIVLLITHLIVKKTKIKKLTSWL